MTVGQVVVQTIRTLRALDCTHEWVKLSDTEDQCKRCSVIATEEGKRNLERLRKRGV